MRSHPTPEKGTHAWYDSYGDVGGRLNWLRAAVLGANDGIVSMAGLLVGVAGAAAGREAILAAGVAGLAAGAMSMAVGEYVSVSAQRDSERGMLELERRELEALPDEELRELAGILVARGMAPDTAHRAAVELTRHDALRSHAHFELGIDPDAYTNPWEAAGASMVSFLVGGAIPFLAILLAPEALAVPVTVVAVVLALAATGVVSARLGRARVPTALVRNVVGGVLAMAITFGIGRLFGVALG